MLFEKPGKENTAATVELALRAAKERGIRDVVVATGRGDTALLFKDHMEDIRLTCVTYAYGFRTPGENPLSDERRQELLDMGCRLVTAAHALSGAERSISRSFGGAYPVEIMAHTLRMFGQGTKVCVEIACMAADAGCVTPGEPVICIGGTGRGADTAMILRPAHTAQVLDTRIDDFICKPCPAAKAD